MVVLIVVLAGLGGAIGGVLAHNSSKKPTNTVEASGNLTPSSSATIAPTSSPTSQSTCHSTVCTRMLNAVSFDSGQMMISGVGPTNGFLYKAYKAVNADPYWEPKWTTEGGNFKYPPTIIFSEAGRMDVLGVNVKSEMCERHWTSSEGWSEDWVCIGGIFSSGPSVASWGPGRLDLFGLGRDGDMFYRTHLPDKGWEAQEDWDPQGGPGGAFRSEPSAVSWGPQRIDVVAVRPDNAVWVTTWDQVWTPWISVNGTLKSGTGPFMVSSGQYRLDIFGIGPDGAIWTTNFNKTQWSEWKSLGGSFASEPVAVISDPNSLELFAVGAEDGGLWHRSMVGDTWSKWESLGGTCNTAPTAVSLASKDVAAFCVDSKNEMSYKALQGGVWGDWKSLAGAFSLAL